MKNDNRIPLKRRRIFDWEVDVPVAASQTPSCWKNIVCRRTRSGSPATDIKMLDSPDIPTVVKSSMVIVCPDLIIGGAYSNAISNFTNAAGTGPCTSGIFWTKLLTIPGLEDSCHPLHRGMNKPNCWKIVSRRGFPCRYSIPYTLSNSFPLQPHP